MRECSIWGNTSECLSEEAQNSGDGQQKRTGVDKSSMVGSGRLLVPYLGMSALGCSEIKQDPPPSCWTSGLHVNHLIRTRILNLQPRTRKEIRPCTIVRTSVGLQQPMTDGGG